MTTDKNSSGGVSNQASGLTFFVVEPDVVEPATAGLTSLGQSPGWIRVYMGWVQDPRLGGNANGGELGSFYVQRIEEEKEPTRVYRVVESHAGKPAPRAAGPRGDNVEGAK